MLVADPLPAPGPASGTNQNAGSVEFTSYAPKRIVLQAKAGVPSVLLLNDKFDPNWKVSVDGKPGTLLRCNYLMRGVYVQSGTHTVEFQFKPRVDAFYVSLAAVLVGVLLIGYLTFARDKERTPDQSGAPSQAK